MSCPHEKGLRLCIRATLDIIVLFGGQLLLVGCCLSVVVVAGGAAHHSGAMERRASGIAFALVAIGLYIQ